MTPEQMEQIILEQGTRLTLLDNIIKAARLGEEHTLAFRCSHSGKYFPPDYTKEWGRKYGIGLGPEPVSETLDSDYLSVLPGLEKLKRPEQLAYAVNSSQAQIDLVEIPLGLFETQSLILAADDPDVERRMDVILPRQLNNSPLLRAMHADFLRKKGAR